MFTKEEVYILEGAKVTQREVYDQRDIDHVYNSKSEKSNAYDGEFDATYTEQVCIEGVLSDTQQKMHNQQEVCDTESKDVMSSGNKAKEERHCMKNFDFISKERKYNNKERDVYNVKDSCVTQLEVYCSKNGNPFNNARKESNTAEDGGVYTRDTEQKSHQLDKNSSYMGDQVIQEKRSTTNVVVM
ncbi:hypothetical protein ACROYT_G032874 [Oculina patagonica]